MKQVINYNSMVIIGMWNKALFNPDWISKNLLPEEELTSELSLDDRNSPRISTKDIRIFISGRKLNLVSINCSNESYQQMEDLSLKIADYLPHTPVSAFGINFQYTESENDELSKLLQFPDDGKLSEFGAEIKNNQLQHCLSIENKLVNFVIARKDDIYKLDFNFHFEIKTLIKFKELLNDNHIVDLREMSLKLLSDKYDLNLD